MPSAARNAVARELATRKYSQRIVAKGKGKGCYRRKEKHRSDTRGGVSSFQGEASRRGVFVSPAAHPH